MTMATAIVDRLAAVLDARTSRRGFLARTAVVGSALAVGPVQYLVRPGTAYASVCGNDSTCGSGYTVFCVTINNGVNRCPPNALVGGWWKADGSGFCCGNARYYIDCHSYCSCGCTGSPFCADSCRACGCGCGPTSSCDQRRVCCNEFRYGQCRPDVACTGPVWCRVVSCTPPWQVPQWACSSSSATDNNTVTHTAPGLPYCTAIDQHYAALGGPGSFLGETQTGEIALAGGAFTVYDGGSIYWSPGTGAHEVHGAIRETWGLLGFENGPLGYPTSDELGSADGIGRYETFAGFGGIGSVHWSPTTGANAVYGAIGALYDSLGGENGLLGRPLTSEQDAPGGGRFNDFVGPGTPTSPQGSIYFSGATGAHSVRGPVRAAWLRVGGAGGRLGYPVAEPLTGPQRTRSTFQGGFIVRIRSTGQTTITYT